MIHSPMTMRLRARVFTLGLSALVASPALAVEWDGGAGNGDFNDPINWSGDALPGSGVDIENAIIGVATQFANPAVVTLDTELTTSPIGDLRVGQGFAGEGTLNHSAGAIVSADFKWSFLGADGDGLDPSKGTYNLSGTASFAQSLADFSTDNQFHIGTGGGRRTVDTGLLPNEGLLTVADDAQFTVNNFFVGNNDDNMGTVEQSGGTVVAQNWLSIGREAGAIGEYNMSGGQLAVVNDGITVGESSGATGSMTISGDSVVDAGRLRVGRSLAVDEETGAGGTGELTVIGGGVDLTVGFLDIGSNDGALTNGEGTLRFEADGGISTLEILNDVTLNDGAIEGFADLTVDLTGVPSGDVELIDVGGLLAGAFRGLPEGAAVPGSGGRTITYTGGDGNDIFLLDANNPDPLAGDANGDGKVDLLDLDILGANFGAIGTGTFATGDFNGDTNVDLLDLDILGGNFGAMTMPAVSIPEPGCAVLFALGLTAVPAFSRRKQG